MLEKPDRTRTSNHGTGPAKIKNKETGRDLKIEVLGHPGPKPVPKRIPANPKPVQIKPVSPVKNSGFESDGFSDDSLFEEALNDTQLPSTSSKPNSKREPNSKPEPIIKSEPIPKLSPVPNVDFYGVPKTKPTIKLSDPVKNDEDGDDDWGDDRRRFL